MARTIIITCGLLLWAIAIAAQVVAGNRRHPAEPIPGPICVTRPIDCGGTETICYYGWNLFEAKDLIEATNFMQGLQPAVAARAFVLPTQDARAPYLIVYPLVTSASVVCP